MLRLIPTWDWDASDLSYDYVINLAQLCQHMRIDYEIVSLNFSPTLRFQLQRQQLTQAHVWSAFDAMQEIDSLAGHPVTLADLIFPATSEQVYSVFGVIIMDHGKVYAKVLPYADELICQVQYFDNNELVMLDYYDDRGFLSRRDLLADGNHEEEHLYFNAQQQLVVTEKVGAIGNQVMINPMFTDRFKQLTYPNLEAVLNEMVAQHYSDVKTPLIVGSSRTPIWLLHQYNALIWAPNQADWLTLLASPPTMAIVDFINHCIQVVIPEKTLKARVSSWLTQAGYSEAVTKLTVIPPYPLGFDLGISNTLTELNVVVHAMAADAKATAAIAVALIPILLANQHVHLQFVGEQDNLLSLIENTVQAWLAREYQLDFASESMALIEAYMKAEMDNRSDEELFKKIRALKAADPEKYAHMLAATKAMQHLHYTSHPKPQTWQALIKSGRLYIDLNSTAELFPSLLTLASGIPQILATPNEYLTVGENGAVVSQLASLQVTVNEYLDNLSKWNKVVVFNVAKAQDYDEAILIKHWQEVGNGKN